MIRQEVRLVIDQFGRDQPSELQECCCLNMNSTANATDPEQHAHAHAHQQQSTRHNEPMMDALNEMDAAGVDAERPYAAMEQQDDMSQKQLVPLGQGVELDEDNPEEDTTNSKTDNGHLAIPEIIETLKNLAACKEKLFKWEQSVKNLESIPDSDPNKSHLMEIIDFVENTKTSTKEKAIYLYEQLGMKCRQHKNYIGAAKAFERAASLRLDISDLNETGDNKESIVTSTIRYLESAIHNYDAIHKFKHAGTLHYRCSRILKMMNASHEEVDRHHEKALEYFTKPDHELKHRKRIDGLKISCYSSFSTLQRMHHEIEKFTHTTTTTTTTNTIKFHADGCYRDSEDSDSNHSTTPPPSHSSGSAHGSNGPMTPAMQFYGEDRHDYHAHNPNDFFDSFMDNNFFESTPERGTGAGADVHAMENDSGPQSQPNGLGTNGASSANSMSKAALEKSNKPGPGSRLHHSSHHHFAHHHETVKDHHHHYHHHKSSSSSSRHLSASSASFSYQKHHKSSSSTTGTMPPLGSPLSALHASQLHKTTFRCIEDRIESARKLVKKLHKLCPFYEVSTNGDDAGRVYCRICDRYLGAVSSTLKNHVNTQEHRQAYEDSQQPQGPGSSSGPSGATQSSSSYAASGAPALPAPLSLPALPAPPAQSAPSAPQTSVSSASGSAGPMHGSYNANTTSSREDLTASGYSSGANTANNQKSYSSEQQPPMILQPGLPLSPFMIQPSPLSYQPAIQTLDSALQKSHLSGKYMDFDLANADQQQQNMIPNPGNWPSVSSANQQAAVPGPSYSQNQGQQQQYLSPLFNTGPTPSSVAAVAAASSGMSMNNLLTFTDALVNNHPVSIIDAAASSKQAMAAAVLMQSNLGHPHYSIPPSVAMGAPNNQTANSNNPNTSQNMPVLAFQ